MPCYDGQAEEEREAAVVERRKLAAILCGVTKLFGKNNILARVDWKEVGVDPSFYEQWCAQHEQEDIAKEKNKNMLFNICVYQPPPDKVTKFEIALSAFADRLLANGEAKCYGELSPHTRINSDDTFESGAQKLLLVDETNIAIRSSNFRYDNVRGFIADIEILATPNGKLLKEILGDYQFPRFIPAKNPPFRIVPRFVNIPNQPSVLVAIDVVQ